MKTANRFSTALLIVTLVSVPALLSACANNGSGGGPRVYGSIGYRGYYGHPWGGYYPPVVVVPPDGIDEIDEIDPDWGVEPPVAPMPDMGMPDYGGDMGMGMDMGGFDF